MAIIESLPVYASFKFVSLTPPVLEKLRLSMEKCKTYVAVRAERGLWLLECYLQITGLSLDLNEEFSRRFDEIAHEFVGAIFSDEFYAASSRTRYEFAMSLQAVFQQFSLTVYPRTSSYLPLKLSYDGISVVINNASQRYLARPKDMAKVALWHGWTFFNNHGIRVILPLYDVYVALGPQFTTRLHEACKTFQLARKRAATPCLKEFVGYLSARREEIKAIDFQSSAFVSEFIRDFGKHYFITCSTNGIASVEYMSKTWMAFKNLVDECFIPGNVFARYQGEFPLAQAPRASGDLCHLSESALGLVKEKLITPVPIQVSDSVAMELLKTNILSDYEIILQWARTEVREMWGKYEQRQKNKNLGCVRHKQKVGGCDGTGWLNNPENPDRYIHAAATFEYHRYLTEFDAGGLHLLYPQPLAQTAETLAIPMRWSLWAHCAVLIANHPNITESMLLDLALYDKFGHRVGFQETDAGGLLVAYKRRKGAALAEVRIDLNAETDEIVRQLIELTEPLRSYLRNKKDENWRLLLLSTGKAFGYPKRCQFEVPPQNTSLKNELVKRLSKAAGIADAYAMKLLSAFTMNSWRATAAIAVYFRSGSALEMSRALGHAHYDVKLMTRYLPSPIFAFFQDRQVRQFQTAIICEAMKDSEYLLIASGLSSKKTLDEFLQNHVIKSVPPFLKQPDGNAEEKGSASSEILFGVNQAILESLIEVHSRVVAGEEDPGMKYWANVWIQLERVIERDATRRPDIFDHLIAARGANQATRRGGQHGQCR